LKLSLSRAPVLSRRSATQVPTRYPHPAAQVPSVADFAVLVASGTRVAGSLGVSFDLVVDPSDVPCCHLLLCGRRLLPKRCQLRCSPVRQARGQNCPKS